MEQTTAIDVLGTLAVLSVVVGKIIEAVRRKFTYLDGGAVTLVAIAIGILAAYGLDLRGTVTLLETIGAAGNRIPPVWLDYAITGAVLAFGAGYLSDFAKRSGPLAPQVSETEVVVPATVAVDTEPRHQA